MSIPTALNELVAALTEHAEVMSGPDVAPERAVDVFERVRAAAVRYSDATFESSGWGSPFSDIFEDEEEDGGEEALGGAYEIPEEAERISLTGRWDFVVSDREAWFSYVTRRLEELGASDCVVEMNSAVEAAHGVISHSDPFDTFTSHGLADGGQVWVIEQVPRTLSEMTDGERDR
jgi:hypothetical protein